MIRQKKYISNSSVSYTQEAASATERQATLISILLDNTYLIQHTTFALSYSVLCDLPDNPIIVLVIFIQRVMRVIHIKMSQVLLMQHWCCSLVNLV